MGPGGSFTCLWELSKGRAIGSAMFAAVASYYFDLFVQAAQFQLEVERQKR
jgi:hypothetical protein